MQNKQFIVLSSLHLWGPSRPKQPIIYCTYAFHVWNVHSVLFAGILFWDSRDK